MYRRFESTKKNSILLLPKPQKSPKKEKRAKMVNFTLLKDLKDMFDLFDKDRDGKITTREVKSLLVSLGRQPSSEEVENLIKETDKDDNGVIDFAEFSEYMQDNYKMEEDYLDEIVAAFKLFDADGDGKISLSEFKAILGEEFNLPDLESILKMVDVDAEGKLTYAEFVELWKYK